MSVVEDIVAYISTSLDDGKYKEALIAPNEEKFANSFRDNCWDLIAVIISKIQDDTIIIKPSLYGACEQLLTDVTEKCSPEEVLLEFIEQIELAKNDAQFGLILPPLQNVLKKLSTKQSRSLEWCLNSISTYIENITLADHNLEGQERILMDSDVSTRRISKVYAVLPPFYRPFMNNEFLTDIKSKQTLTAFLISLLGKPLIYIDLDPEKNEKSEARLSCSMIIEDICSLEKNVLKFLPFIEACYRENLNQNKNINNNEEVHNPYENRQKVNVTTLSGLYYVVFSGHFNIPDNVFPHVYQLDYVVHTVMLCVNHLLSFPEYSPVDKALALCESILSRLPVNLPIEFFNVVHIDMCKGLVNIAIYSTYESHRKRAVVVIGKHVNKFDYKGRCMLLMYLVESSNHSGMIGYSITMLKNSINEAFSDSTLPACFTGSQLLSMIKKICYLPHGAESDLVELADQIISTLNFLRYLIIKDVDNQTGIKNHFTFIESNYIEKLRVGLNMSKAHYEVKLKDIEEGKDFSDESSNVSINVGGNILDQIPRENKKQIIYSALNAFHLIEGLVARVSECINISKMQTLNMNCD